jgi:hypothetical protein
MYRPTFYSRERLSRLNSHAANRKNTKNPIQPGLPAVCLDHYGAREVMRPDCGLLVPEERLREAIASLLLDPERRAGMSVAARDYAATLRFSDSAARMAEIISHPKQAA